MRMIALLCCVVGAHAAANGPAWVAELSATGTERPAALEVICPLGGHVAVGVYNTDAIQPLPPAGITATVRVQWFEHRTIYQGMPEEREAAIPYYLPEPKDCSPTGAWVVELEPVSAGSYSIPIECNTNTVTVKLTCIDLPESAIGYGFYTDHHRYGDITQEAAYDADMAAHGMNTFTPYAREIPFAMDNSDYARILAWHIDTAIEQGLVDTRFPLLCLAIEPKDLPRARAFAKHQWPELVGYNYDEPAVEKGPEVAEYAKRWHDVDLRTATAIDGEIARKIGDPLDIWVIHMDSMTQAAIDLCRERGKARWLYNCSLRGSNAPLHRYMTGVYTWAMQPEVCLIWTYMHDPTSRIKPDGTWNLLRVYDTATCDAQGKPIPTVALEGLADGIVDSRLLQALEQRNTPEGNAYLASLRERVDMKFWPLGRNRDYSKSYVWDVPDTAVPPIDMVQMRKDLLRLLGGAGQ